MNAFKRNLAKNFSKKKFLLYHATICKICKSDRGLIHEAKLCYKCCFNYLKNYTNFK